MWGGNELGGMPQTCDKTYILYWWCRAYLFPSYESLEQVRLQWYCRQLSSYNATENCFPNETHRCEPNYYLLSLCIFHRTLRTVKYMPSSYWWPLMMPATADFCLQDVKILNKCDLGLSFTIYTFINWVIFFLATSYMRRLVGLKHHISCISHDSKWWSGRSLQQISDVHVCT